MSHPQAAVTISGQVALILGENSGEAAQSQDGVSLNNRTVPETIHRKSFHSARIRLLCTAHQTFPMKQSNQGTHFVAALMTSAS